jgi:hypothetical protein
VYTTTYTAIIGSASTPTPATLCCNQAHHMIHYDTTPRPATDHSDCLALQCRVYLPRSLAFQRYTCMACSSKVCCARRTRDVRSRPTRPPPGELLNHIVVLVTPKATAALLGLAAAALLFTARCHCCSHLHSTSSQQEAEWQKHASADTQHMNTTMGGLRCRYADSPEHAAYAGCEQLLAMSGAAGNITTHCQQRNHQQTPQPTNQTSPQSPGPCPPPLTHVPRGPPPG